MKPQRLLLLGSVLIDLVSAVPALPPRGGDVVASPGPATPGGGFTVLAAAARAGLPSVYAGVHGSGPFGAAVRGALDADGVAAAFAPAAAERGDTGYCVVLVEPDGERTFVTVPGVEAALTTADLTAISPRPGDAVYVSGYDLGYPVNGPLLGPWCADLPPGCWLVLDPGPLLADIPMDRLRAVLARTDLLTLNAREASVLGPQPAVGPGCVVVRRNGPGETSISAGGTELARHRPPAVRALDTTGAGDVHTGALLAARHAALDWPAALAYADAAAASSVTRSGPAQG